MSTTKVYPNGEPFYMRQVTTTYGGTSTLVSSSNGTTRWDDTVVLGDNLPDWKGKLLRGEDCTTGLDVDGKSLEITPGTLIGIRRAPTGAAGTIQLWRMTGDFGVSKEFHGTNPASIDLSKANATALGKFVKRVNQVNTAFNGGVFLGELAQTIRGIKRPAQGLRNAVDAFRRRGENLRSRAQRSGINRHRFDADLADLWLESQFHWRPLINDVKQGAVASAQLVSDVERRPRSVPVRAQAEVRTNGTVTKDGYATGGLLWDIVNKSYHNSVVVYRGSVRVVDLTTPEGVAVHLGIDLASFIPTAWELVPYSFLIDYFTNVGEIVNGLSFPRSRLTWSNKTTVRESVVERVSQSKDTHYVGSSYRLSSHSAVKVIAKRRLISRASYTGSFIPDLVLEVPGSGSLKWLNMAALGIAQSRDRRFRWL